MAERAVKECGVSIRLACQMFKVSQSCYRYESKTNAENEQIEQWLIRLADNHLRLTGSLPIASDGDSTLFIGDLVIVKGPSKMSQVTELCFELREVGHEVCS
jgi:hypothetical protein